MEKINWLDFKGTANPISDAYREIRVNLQHQAGGKSITFTSLRAVAEHSSVVAGLAITLAQGGQKVLLIDCNLVSPSQHILFDLPNQGLSESLANDTDLQEAIQHCIEQQNLDILTGGTVGKQESLLFTGDAVYQFLQKAGNDYDYILLDMPALDISAEAVVVSSHTDGTVLVLTQGEDKLNQLADAKSRLEQAGGKLLGCILDKMKIAATY